MKHPHITIGCMAMLLALCASMALSADGPKTTIAGGLVLTDGNSETLQAHASATIEGEKEGLGSFRAGIEGAYGESTTDDTTETTTETAKLFGQTRKTLTERSFAYIDAAVLYDDPAAIDYRATIGPGAGIYVVQNEKIKLSVELGIAYVAEDVAGMEDDYVALRIAERCDVTLSETAKAWQSIEYMPDLDAFEDSAIVTAELGLEAALSDRMNLRLVIQDRYDSTPGDGQEENDLTVISGVSLNL